MTAIASFSAADVISYAFCPGPPISAMRDHGDVLKMVPSSKDFHAEYYVDFHSDYIAETVIAMDKESLRQLSKIVIAQDDGIYSMSSSEIRDTIYRVLCHRWLNQQQTLQFRSLGLGPPFDLILGKKKNIIIPTTKGEWVLPGDMKIMRFSTLCEIRAIPLSRTYFRSTSSAFKPLDAFILNANKSECCGLVVTRSPDHGIEAAPLNRFLKWLQRVGIPAERFSLCFITPSNLEQCFEAQTMRTNTDETIQHPEPSTTVNQFVAAFDAFIEWIPRNRIDARTSARAHCILA